MHTLSTERLKLRPWTLDDVDAAFALYGDPEVTRYLGTGAYETDIETQRDHLAKAIERYEVLGLEGYGFWAAEEKSTSQVIGSMLLKPLALADGQEPRKEDPEIEVGWHLAKRYWGMGFGTEMGRAGIEHGFGTVGLERIYAVAYPENVASVRIMQKLGMRSMGETERYYRSLLALYMIERPQRGN